MVVCQDTEVSPKITSPATAQNRRDPAHPDDDEGVDEYDEELDEKSTDFIDETFDIDFSPDGYTDGLVCKV